MAVFITLTVPKISKGQDALVEFIAKIQSEYNKGNNIRLDFKDVVVISSMILGFTMVLLKKNPLRIAFINIRPAFKDNLKKMIGALAEKLEKGSVSAEDIKSLTTPKPISQENKI